MDVRVLVRAHSAPLQHKRTLERACCHRRSSRTTPVDGVTTFLFPYYYNGGAGCRLSLGLTFDVQVSSNNLPMSGLATAFVLAAPRTARLRSKCVRVGYIGSIGSAGQI